MSPNMTATLHIIGIIIIILALALTGCNKKAPEPVPATNLSDECYRSDRVKSCEVTLKIEFKDGEK